MNITKENIGKRFISLKNYYDFSEGDTLELKEVDFDGEGFFESVINGYRDYMNEDEVKLINNNMIKLNGEYTEEQLLQIIEDNKRKWEYFQLSNHEIALRNRKKNLMFEMTKFAEFHNEGWKADWKDSNQVKFGVEHFGRCFSTDYYSISNQFVFGISVKTIEIAEEMLEEFKDELEIYLQS